MHRPHERRCTWKFTFPPSGNTIRNRQFRVRECNQNFTSLQAEIWNDFCAPSPRAEMHMKIYISHSREYYPAPTIPLAEMQKKILHLRERIFCYYFGSRSRLRKCTISCVSPRAEIRSGGCISASRMCKRMCTASGTARNSVIFNTCYPAPTILLAEMQPKYCITASGGLLLFQFLSPAWGNAPKVVHSRERKREADAASPLRGNASGCVQYRKRYCT